MSDSNPRGRAARLQAATTGIERHVDPKRPIVTKTDLKGKITYANPAFVEMSGYSEDELIGQPHNIVRHPDMPREAFADLWSTLRAGVPWRGRVKNRSKTGDHYWVDAYVSDLTEGGAKVGYMSVRVPPAEKDKTAAEALYAQIRAGKAKLPATPTRLGHSVMWEIAIALSSTALLAVAAALLPGAWAAGAAVASCLVAAGTGVWVARMIRMPVERIKKELRELAEANLKVDDHRETRREFAGIRVALQTMKVNLRAVMSDVVAAANDVDAGCEHLCTDTAQVMQRLTAQSEGIGSVAAALQQLSVSVAEISDATERSTQHAGKAIEVVNLGEEQMNRSLEASHEAVRAVQDAQARITRLESEVAGISAVTQTIQAIAEQTNLLALNAAIEAARAGEQGRGFAVVADEVRKLAERTHSSTVDIASKVNEIQTGTGAAVDAMRAATDGVTAGAERIKATGESLKGIADASRGVESAAREIALMLAQQKQASQEVASTMERMNCLTDENVGSFQKVQGAVEELARTASALHTLLHHFERKM